MQRSLTTLLLAVVLMVGSSSLVCAQAAGAGGVFRGTVRDASGMALPGTTTGFGFPETKVDDTGSFSFSQLAPGRHTFVFEHPAFALNIQTITILANEIIERDLIMKPSPDCPVGADANPPAGALRSSDYIELTRPSELLHGDRVRIGADGKVTWVGTFLGGSLVFPGTARVRPEDAQALIEKYRAGGFWTLCHEYLGRPNVTDQGVDTVIVQIGGQLRRVTDQAYAAPPWMRALNAEGDKLANTERWLRSHSHFAVGAVLSIPGRTWNDVRRQLTGITNLNGLDANGWTVLMYATQLPWPPQEIRSLLRAGANANVRSSTGETALTLAAAGGSPEWVRALIAAGADVNARNGDGQTALLAAVHHLGGNADERLLEIAAMLRTAGARTDIRDNAGMTVFSYVEQDEKRAAPYWRPNYSKLRHALEK